MCTVAANERHSKSDESYRMRVADSEYPMQLEALCGKGGVGGRYPFEIKKRKKSRDGGDWTFEESITKRVMANGSIYLRGKMAMSAANNVYVPRARSQICTPHRSLLCPWIYLQV